MATRSVRLDHAAIENLLHGRTGDVARMMGGFAGLATRTTREVADERITHRTGNYRRSIKATLVRPDRLIVEASTDYAVILETGSRPHVIVPRRARVLVFQVGGRTVFAMRVQHPGTKPYNILRDGVGRAATQLNRLARR